MSIAPHFPAFADPDPETLDTVIVPRARDLGGFEVRRVLPEKTRQMIGPFIFFDQMGPAHFGPDTAVDVRPHPHIGLATLTYLFEGVLRHKDSLGTTQDITPGAANWMVAGRGITHSERTPDEIRGTARTLSGLQTWLALPRDVEEIDPRFVHSPSGGQPRLSDKGVEMTVIAGHAYGARAPIPVFSDTLYVDVHLAPGTRLPLPTDHEDRAVHVLSGRVEVAGQTIAPGQMAILREGRAVTITAGDLPTHLVLVGGQVADGPRHIWWNFVASSKDKIETAKVAWKAQDWANGPFQLPPHDNGEFIPLD